MDIGCGMVAARLSLTANVLVEKALQKVFDQITRGVPVGRGQHADDRVLVEAARPFEPGLKALTERHPQLLKAFGKFSKWIDFAPSLFWRTRANLQSLPTALT